MHGVRFKAFGYPNWGATLSSLCMTSVVLFFLELAPTHAGVYWSGPQNIEMGGGWPPGQGGIGNVRIDYDSDGTVDCHIQNTYGTDFFAIPQSGPDGIMNQITAEDRGISPRCWPLDYGTQLGPNLPGEIIWHAEAEPLIEWRISGEGEILGIGTWAGVSNRYMGVRFDTGAGDTHYGWIQMTVFGDRSAAIVHDWAWNTVPGVPIVAGDTGFHYVSLSGSNVPPYSSWATAATNIQAAVDVADDGHVVIITNGIYTVTNEITVTNGITVRSFAGAAVTTVAGGYPASTNRCFHLMHPDAVVSNLTITNGHAPDDEFLAEGGFGGGILCENGGTVRDCVLTDNVAGLGAGVCCLNTGTVRGCFFTNNTAFIGGGFALLTDSVLAPVTNIVTLSTGSGGSQLFASDCEVAGNHADQAGGGIALIAGTASNCLMYGNTSNAGGGAACTGDGMLMDSVLRENTGQSGGGIVLTEDGQALRCQIERNQADSGAGALLFSGGLLRNCLITENEATSVGGVLLSEGGSLENCTVATNSATETGGIYLQNGGQVVNTIVYFNHAPTNGSNWFVEGPGAIFSHTCTVPGPGGTGNTTNDPQFIGLSAGDFHLSPASPCVDAGTNAPSVAGDLDGIPRPLDGDADLAAAWDIGAYEYINPFADTDGDGLTDTNELDTIGTSPIKADTDDDQMPDGWEVDNTLDPLVDDAGQDPDFDTMNNGGEYVADTNPRDGDSVLSIINVAAEYGGIRVDWKGGRDAWQILECRSDLTSTTDQWTAIFGVPPPTPLTNAIIDLGATNHVLFYRIRAER